MLASFHKSEDHKNVPLREDKWEELSLCDRERSLNPTLNNNTLIRSSIVIAEGNKTRLAVVMNYAVGEFKQFIKPGIAEAVERERKLVVSGACPIVTQAHIYKPIVISSVS